MFTFFRRKKEPEQTIKPGDMVYIADHCCEHTEKMRNHFFVVPVVLPIFGARMSCGLCTQMIDDTAYVPVPDRPWNIPQKWLRKVPPRSLVDDMMEELTEHLSKQLGVPEHFLTASLEPFNTDDEPCPK